MDGEIILDGHKLFLSDEFDASKGGTLKSPTMLGGTCVRITLEVKRRRRIGSSSAVAAGVGVVMPLENLFWGARYGKNSRSIRTRVGHQPATLERVTGIEPATFSLGI